VLAGNISPGDAPGYPATLSKTGSYRLDGNLIPGAGKNGIEITGDFVSLDMAGFTLHGRNMATYGITGKGKGTRIENGSISGFKLDGIRGVGKSWTIENMLVTENGEYGISVVGDGDLARVLHSNASYNGGIGIYCYSCHLEGNVAAQNGSYGAWIEFGTVLGNTFLANKKAGVKAGYYVGHGNNSFVLNNSGKEQGSGINLGKLDPDYCVPTPCP
jgi:hypothetical protein